MKTEDSLDVVRGIGFSQTGAAVGRRTYNMIPLAWMAYACMKLPVVIATPEEINL